jgi:acetamidase/formamidase
MPDIKADHVVLASTKTIHWGFFDSALPPVCTIKSGETVTIPMRVQCPLWVQAV